MTDDPVQACTSPQDRRKPPPHPRAPIGTVTTRKDGHTVVKTADGWRYMSRLIAERVIDAPLPLGATVTFADGDRSNLTPENICVPVPVAKLAPRPARRRTPRVEVALGDHDAQVRAAAEAAGVTVSAWIMQVVVDYFG